VTGIAIVGRILASICMFGISEFGSFASYIGPNYPVDLLNMPGGFLFSGVAWHCYGGDPSAMSDVAEKFASWTPHLEQHMTECSGGGWTGSWEKTLVSDQANLFIGGALNYGQSVLRWNLALDERHGPRCQGGSCCTNCGGVVTIPSNAKSVDDVTFTSDYYGLAHHSAFFEPGTVRIFTSTAGPARAVAYKTPSGKIYVVALNEKASSAVPLHIVDRATNVSFQFSLPPGVATFVWNP
jgi:glucosylceramidase